MRGHITGLDGNVHRRVAHAHNDHAFTRQLGDITVLVSVHLLALEATGERWFWVPGVIVVTAGHNDKAVRFELPRGQGDVPAALRPGSGPGHLGPEVDQGTQPKVVHVGIEVGRHFLVVREVSRARRHGEVGVLHVLPVAIDVQGTVSG